MTEASLSSLVADLRSAIGDEAHESTFIRTVHRHGYAFGEARALALPGQKPAKVGPIGSSGKAASLLSTWERRFLGTIARGDTVQRR